MNDELRGELIADLSDGFTQIPNRLLDALTVAKLTPTQNSICKCIIRFTYGWDLKGVPISVNDFAAVFNVDRKWILSQLRDLLCKRVIIKTGKLEDNTSVWKMNPNISEWDPSILDHKYLIILRNINPHKLFHQQSLWKAYPDPDIDMTADDQIPEAEENCLFEYTENNSSSETEVNHQPEAANNSSSEKEVNHLSEAANNPSSETEVDHQPEAANNSSSETEVYHQPEAADNLLPGVVVSTPPGVVVSTPPGVVVSTPPGVVVSTPPGVVVSTPPGVVVSTPPPDQSSDLENSLLQPPLNTVLNTYINKTKYNSFKYSEDSIQFCLARLLMDKIYLNNPKFKKPDLQQWALHIDRMIKYDKRDPETIKKVILYAQEDDFWSSNIMCTKNLRKHFDRLDAKRLKKERNRKRWSNQKSHQQSYQRSNQQSNQRSYKKEVENKDEYDFFFKRKT
jgi:phage replication O-like protein O